MFETPSAPQPVVLHARVVTGNGGGPDKTILNSPRFLRALGYDSACAYLHPPGDPGFDELRARAAGADAELISIPDRGLTDVSVVPRLVRICRERNVSIWHGHDYKSDALGLLLRRFHPMKLVSTVHGWGVRSRRTPLYHAVDRFALKQYDRVICVSLDLLQQCLAAGVPVERCSEISNAIDLDAYTNLPGKAAARRRFGIEADLPVIVGIGRLSREKAFDQLIQAVDDLLETGTQAQLLIAGDGPERAKLQKLIDSRGRQREIRLLGHISNPVELLAAADVFALSSISEGLPNVVLEAMACGVPVLASAVGAVPTIITDEVNGLLVAPGDAVSLSRSLLRLVSNDALRAQFAAAGPRTVEQQFSFAHRMQRIAAIYDDVLSRTHVMYRPDNDPIRTESAIRTENNVRPPADAAGEAPLNAGEGDQSLATASEGRRTDNDPDAEPASREATSPGSTTSPPGHLECASPAGTAPASLLAEAAPAPDPVPSPDHLTHSAVRVELTSTPGIWSRYLQAKGHAGFYQQAAWLRVLRAGLGHQPVCLQAISRGELAGVLPLAFVNSRLFGRFLVSLPYLNSSGVVAESPEIAAALVNRAIEFADELDVRYLELRHETTVDHPQLSQAVNDKVHMRLTLPDTSEDLWNSLKSKLRSQIRKPMKNESLSIQWGGHELLDDFYRVFTSNMRDLGTPPFSRRLFAAMLTEFPDAAEICTVRLNGLPIASALLMHGPGVTEVPSASSLRRFNSTSANMLLYWHLLVRAVERGQQVFDFGRSSRNTGTWRFKAQWGAEEAPAVWQHYVRKGEASDMRPDSGKYDLMIRAWQKLPVCLTRLIGPTIVRGIP